MPVTLEVKGGRPAIQGSNALDGGTVSVSGSSLVYRPQKGKGSQVAAPKKDGRYSVVLRGGSLSVR